MEECVDTSTLLQDFAAAVRELAVAQEAEAAARETYIGQVAEFRVGQQIRTRASLVGEVVGYDTRFRFSYLVKPACGETVSCGHEEALPAEGESSARFVSENDYRTAREAFEAVSLATGMKERAAVDALASLRQSLPCARTGQRVLFGDGAGARPCKVHHVYSELGDARTLAATAGELAALGPDELLEAVYAANRTQLDVPLMPFYGHDSSCVNGRLEALKAPLPKPATCDRLLFELLPPVADARLAKKIADWCARAAEKQYGANATPVSGRRLLVAPRINAGTLRRLQTLLMGAEAVREGAERYRAAKILHDAPASPGQKIVRRADGAEAVVADILPSRADGAEVLVVDGLSGGILLVDMDGSPQRVAFDSFPHGWRLAPGEISVVNPAPEEADTRSFHTFRHRRHQAGQLVASEICSGGNLGLRVYHPRHGCLVGCHYDVDNDALFQRLNELGERAGDAALLTAAFETVRLRCHDPFRNSYAGTLPMTEMIPFPVWGAPPSPVGLGLLAKYAAARTPGETQAGWCAQLQATYAAGEKAGC